MPDRHEKLSQALGLIMSLAATRYGRTVAEMMEDLDCSRRTVERLLAAIRQACVDIEEVHTDEREKRWRIRPNRLVGAVRMTAEEIAEIEAAAARLQQEGLSARAATLRGAANQLRAMMDEAARRRAESDVEALLSSEGLASRPGPRVEVAEGVIETLRQALLASRRVRLRYRSTTGGERDHVLEPCGLLYGARPYLLAVKPGKPEPAIWRLDRVVEVKATEEGFVPREGCDVTTLMRDCFGVWREDPMDVVLRFDARAATDASCWRFHASQEVSPEPDGALLVRLRAGGIEEMANHLATWGDTVEVLSPPALREQLAWMGETLARHHARKMEDAPAGAAPAVGPNRGSAGTASPEEDGGHQVTELTTETRALLHRALDILEPVAEESGAVLYSGHDTLAPGSLYVMGLNPGGDPDQLRAAGSVIWRSLVRTRCHWNAYVDENWKTETEPSDMQKRVRKLFSMLNLQPRQILTTNAIFTRSRTADKIEGLWDNWWNYGWPVHRLFLQAVRPRVILCLGCGPDSPFGLLQTPMPYRGRVQRLWQKEEEAAIGSGRLVRQVEFGLQKGAPLVCAVAALPHPSRFPKAYDEDELRPFLTEIALIIRGTE